MTFGELFAGIGGFSLGLERAGMTCKWQVEIEPYARAVLKKHWPEVSKHDDVRTFPPAGDYAVDLICGGFPCQDISVAGKGAGLAGARSGLWHEFARIIGELRPRYVVVENVAALATRGLDTVLGALSTLGYDAEWHVIPACAVGAPHRRERLWIVAYSDRADGEDIRHERGGQHKGAGAVGSEKRSAVLLGGGSDGTLSALSDAIGVADAVRGDGSPCSQGVAGRTLHVGGGERDRGTRRAGQAGQGSGDVSDADRAGREQQRRPEPVRAEQLAAQCGGWWSVEPDVGRVAYGVPSRVDRLRCLGNAVVPQIVEVIGRAILAAEERRMTA
jgi:DNA (cytosine-5)-methyltransferase 1